MNVIPKAGSLLIKQPLFGVGLRPTHYSFLLNQGPRFCQWFEVITENFMDSQGRPREILEKFRARYPMAVHGVSLSIGSSDPLNLDYVQRLKKFVDAIEPRVVSDHFCWTGVGGYNFHDLLPLPLTKAQQDYLTLRIEKVQSILGRKMIFENVSSYITYKQSEMSEWEFIVGICQRSGCGLLLDVNNVYVNATNHGFDPYEYIASIPPQIIEQIHLGGFSDEGNFLFDTHSNPVFEKVWDLYRFAVQRAPQAPIIFEWDQNIPEFPKLESELLRAQKIWQEVHHE